MIAIKNRYGKIGNRFLLHNRIPIFPVKSICDFHLQIGSRLKTCFGTASTDGTWNRIPIFMGKPISDFDLKIDLRFSFRNRIPVLRMQSRSRSRSKTNPDRPRSDFDRRTGSRLFRSYVGTESFTPVSRLPLQDLTPEKFCFGSTSLPCPLPFQKWPFFAKRGPFRAIPETGIISLNEKSGELGENGTMRRFYWQDWARMEILTTWHKIRANTRNWEAKVLLSPAGARILKGGVVLGVTTEADDGGILAFTWQKKLKTSGSQKNF
jgi:hypothetical protein